MKKVVLIACVGKKLPHRAKAKDIYVSPLFRLSLQYAQAQNPEAIFVLSAKHGLLPLETEIEPYNTTLKQARVSDVKGWARGVLAELSKRFDLTETHVVFLAGERYRRYLVGELASVAIPLQGLGIGKQLRYLKAHT